MPRSTRAQIYWVPRPGDWLADDILAWAEEGLTDVVSFLEEHEARELGLRTEGACVIQAGLQLESFPVPDHGVPRRIRCRCRPVEPPCPEDRGCRQRGLALPREHRPLKPHGRGRAVLSG